MAGDELDELLRASLQRGSVKDAVAHAVELSGRPRREIYARALELAKETARDTAKVTAKQAMKGDDGED
jgi:16S rRNA (cytidine1402-2'-O)-methyltransferase